MTADIEMMDARVRATLGVRFLAELLGLESGPTAAPILDEAGNDAFTAAPSLNAMSENWRELRKRWKAEAEQRPILQVGESAI